MIGVLIFLFEEVIVLNGVVDCALIGFDDIVFSLEGGGVSFEGFVGIKDGVEVFSRLRR